MVRLVAGAQDKLCSQCPGGLTKMEKLPHTSTFICPICSGLEYYIPKESEEEEEDEDIE